MLQHIWPLAIWFVPVGLVSERAKLFRKGRNTDFTLSHFRKGKELSFDFSVLCPFGRLDEQWPTWNQYQTPLHAEPCFTFRSAKSGGFGLSRSLQRIHAKSPFFSLCRSKKAEALCSFKNRKSSINPLKRWPSLSHESGSSSSFLFKPGSALSLLLFLSLRMSAALTDLMSRTPPPIGPELALIPTGANQIAKGQICCNTNYTFWKVRNVFLLQI